MHPAKEFMEAAIDEAIKSREAGDYAVGAVVVKDGKIIARAGNRVKLDEDPFYHAEILAIRNAAKSLGKRHLSECVLYTTHEPCPMCASDVVWARMKGIVYGAKISDMIKFRKTNGNGDWSWKTIDIPVSVILEKGDSSIFLVKEFMRNECNELFHS